MPTSWSGRTSTESGINSVEKLPNYKRADGAKPIVAATALGSGTWVFGTYVFEVRGLGHKVNWVAGGGPNTMFPSLQTKQFDAIMAPPSWIVEVEKKGFGRTVYDTSKPGVFEKDFSGTLPVAAELPMYRVNGAFVARAAAVTGGGPAHERTSKHAVLLGAGRAVSDKPVGKREHCGFVGLERDLLSEHHVAGYRVCSRTKHHPILGCIFHQAPRLW